MHLSIHLYTLLSIFLSLSLSPYDLSDFKEAADLRVNPATIYISICVTLFLSISLSLSIHLSIHLSIYLSLSVYLS